MDMAADPLRLRYGGPAWFAKFIGRLIPKPDITIILDVPQQQLLSRKRELPEAELKRQRAYYKNYALRSLNTVILDGSLPQDEVAASANDAVLAYMYGRFPVRKKMWTKVCNAEAIDRMTSILSADERKARFALKCRDDTPDAGWKDCDSFIWLDFKDGRGYMIPKSGREALRAGLDVYNPQRVMAKAAKWALKLWIRIGAPLIFFPEVRLLIREDIPASERAKILLTEEIKEKLGRDDLVFAISGGTPSPNRKPTIKIMTDKGEVLGYAKAGYNDATIALVRNEAEVLRNLKPASFKIPRLLYEGRWQGRYLTIQSPPAGKARDLPAVMDMGRESILKELSSVNFKQLRYEEAAFWKRIIARVGGISNSYHRHLAKLAIGKVRELVSDKPIGFSFSHGDFAPWNMKLAGNDIFLFDWESACSEAPLGMDTIHLYVQTMHRIRKRPPYEAYDRYRGNAIFVMYVLDKFVFYAREENSNRENIDFFSALMSRIIDGGRDS